jgi:hypothetical protein
LRRRELCGCKTSEQLQRFLAAWLGQCLPEVC